MKPLPRALCWLGLHHWVEPYPPGPRPRPMRTCIRCGREEPLPDDWYRR